MPLQIIKEMQQFCFHGLIILRITARKFEKINKIVTIQTVWVKQFENTQNPYIIANHFSKRTGANIAHCSATKLFGPVKKYMAKGATGYDKAMKYGV